MPFQIEAEETLREAILRTRNERLDKAIAALQGKPQPSAEAIHDARREFKRLRSLVRLVRGSMDKPVRVREDQALGNVGRALAQSRDAAALLETVEKVFGTLMPEDRKSRRISAEGQKLLQQVREELRSATASEDWSVTVGKGLWRTYRQGRELFAVSNSIGLLNASDELWHESRKRAKTLGYQLRFLRKIWPGTLNAIAEQLEELSERLGEDHDLALIRLRLTQIALPETNFELFSAARLNLIRTIDRRRRRLQNEALRRSRLVYLEQPRRFLKRMHSYWDCWRSQQPHPPTPSPVQPANSALV